MGGYADYAFAAGTGINIEFGFSVSKGWYFMVNHHSNLGWGYAAGGYISASVSAPSAQILKDISVEFVGTAGVGASIGNKRVGGNVSLGVGSFGGVSLSYPIYGK